MIETSAFPCGRQLAYRPKGVVCGFFPNYRQPFRNAPDRQTVPTGRRRTAVKGTNSRPTVQNEPGLLRTFLNSLVIRALSSRLELCQIATIKLSGPCVNHKMRLRVSARISRANASSFTARARIRAPTMEANIWIASPRADRRERHGKCVEIF